MRLYRLKIFNEQPQQQQQDNGNALTTIGGVGMAAGGITALGGLGRTAVNVASAKKKLSLSGTSPEKFEELLSNVVKIAKRNKLSGIKSSPSEILTEAGFDKNVHENIINATKGSKVKRIGKGIALAGLATYGVGKMMRRNNNDNKN